MSATYRTFSQWTFTGQIGGRFSLDYDLSASLLDSAYVFSEAHVSVAASLAAHFVGANQAVTLPRPFDTLTLVDLAALFVDDAVGNFAPSGAGVKALAIYDVDEPLLYLDTFVGLPGTTLGGEVEALLAEVLAIG